jgi:hypothetical protein
MGNANPLFEGQEDTDDNACELRLYIPINTPEQAGHIGNDSQLQLSSPGQCTAAESSNDYDPFAEFATPPCGGLLPAFRTQLLSSPVLCALIRMQQCNLHPVGKGLDTIDFTVAGGKL